MGWIIKVRYETGHTFESWEEEARAEVILSDKTRIKEFVWDKQKDAQEALKRLVEHYNWQDSLGKSYKKELPKPKWLKKFNLLGYSSDWHFNVPGNNNEDVWICGSKYLGYFESLREAWIESNIKNEDRNRYTF